MGYADKTQEIFLVRFSPRQWAPQREPTPLWQVERPNCSWGKLNLISDFLQSIVVPAVPFDSLNPKAAAGLFSATEVDFKTLGPVYP
ncbi:MAG TPA: hypothetical protein VNY10_10435 [Roseiarcus sp.]|nr:hypothetical protein [Roseiarcus sp.]